MGFLLPILCINQDIVLFPFYEDLKGLAIKSFPLKFSMFNIVFKMLSSWSLLDGETFPKWKAVHWLTYFAVPSNFFQILFYFWIFRNYLTNGNQESYVIWRRLTLSMNLSRSVFSSRVYNRVIWNKFVIKNRVLDTQDFEFENFTLLHTFKNY